MRFILILICSVLLLSACKGGLTDEQKKAFKEELEQREIKRLTPGEVNDAVFQQGSIIADTLAQVGLTENFDAATLQTSVLTAEDYPVLDSLNRKYKVHIRWVGANVSKDTPVLMPLESQLLDAYLYNVENRQEVGKNVQGIDEKSFLFTQPVLSDKKLKGMWSITLLQKEVILGL